MPFETTPVPLTPTSIERIVRREVAELKAMLQDITKRLDDLTRLNQADRVPDQKRKP